MKKKRLFFVMLMVFSTTVMGQSLPDSTISKVDQLFEKWNKSGQPGCVAGIVQEDKLVYAKGFGLANLENNTPNTPASIYYMCSVSKQFAGYAVALLAGAGKINLDNDIHVYLPWLGDFGKTITVRHLLHHTSGIRDDIGLAQIIGPGTDLLNQPTAIQLLKRQRTLNFAPGEKFSYSNSNYVLLAEIVKAVSGQSFSDYTTATIFRPLGMSDTRFVDDPATIIPNRAASYWQESDQTFRNSLQYVYTLGDGGLFTNIPDMAKWISNFYTSKAGTAPDILLLTTLGKLNNGKTISYAMGINADTYRGQKRFQHNGGLAGYRTVIAIYPDLHLGFMVFGNGADGAIYSKIDQLSALFIPPTTVSPAPPAAVPPGIEVDTFQLKKWTGRYIADNGYKVSVTLDSGHLMMDGQTALTAASAQLFYLSKRPSVKYQFQAAPDGKTIRLNLISPVLDKPMQLRKVPETPLHPDTYAGTYYSPELATSFRITVKEQQLVISDDKHGEATVTPYGPDDLFTGFDFLKHLSVKRDAKNRITGFDLNSGEMMNLNFEKINKEMP